MQLSAHSWSLRRSARHAMTSGDFERAFLLAAQAQQAQRTPAGGALHTLCAWLRDETLAP